MVGHLLEKELEGAVNHSFDLASSDRSHTSLADSIVRQMEFVVVDSTVQQMELEEVGLIVQQREQAAVD